MRIAELRRNHPEWSWRAERHGFGYRYVGLRESQAVTISAVSVLCGPADDDAETRWDAETSDGRRMAYAAWWMIDSARRGAGKDGERG